jgi:hypothetical protein
MLAIRSLYADGRRAAPRNMAGKEIMARYGDAKDIKAPWLGHLEECYRYSMPQKNTIFTREMKGQKRNFDVFDATAVLGVPKFASNIQGRIMPPWRDWSELTLGPEYEAQAQGNQRIAEMLSQQTDLFFAHIHASNHAQQAHEALMDLAIGTGCYDAMHGQLGGKAIVYNAIPLPELTLEEGPNSTIETTYRDIEVRARNIARQWGPQGLEIPPRLERLIKESPNAKIRVCEAVIFDPETWTFEGAAVWTEEAVVFWRGSWNTNPRTTFRWSVTPGELYGRGPIMQALPDIKTANKVTEFILRNAALAVSGMWTASSDSALNPYNFRIVPGAVIPVMSNDARNPSIRALERSGDLRIGFEVLDQLQRNIRRALLEDMRDPDGPVRSATEIAIADRELITYTGSSFGRLLTEVTEATVIRAVDVLSSRGIMANLPIDGQRVALKHTSPLAKAQDLDDLFSLERMQQSVPPEALVLGVKLEELGTYVARKMGIDPALIRPEAEKAALQEKAAQMLAQMQAAQAA